MQFFPRMKSAMFLQTVYMTLSDIILHHLQM